MLKQDLSVDSELAPWVGPNLLLYGPRWGRMGAHGDRSAWTLIFLWHYGVWGVSRLLGQRPLATFLMACLVRGGLDCISAKDAAEILPSPNNVIVLFFFNNQVPIYMGFIPKIHPLSCPHGWDLMCLLGAESLIYFVHLLSYIMKNCISLDHV